MEPIELPVTGALVMLNGKRYEIHAHLAAPATSPPGRVDVHLVLMPTGGEPDD